MATREPIYSALWSLVTGDPGVASAFVTMSRYTKHFEDVPGQLMPALFMLEKRERWERPGKGVSPKRTLQAHFLCYTDNANPDAVPPSIIINTLMDAIDNVLTNPGTPDNAVTLGGLVEHVYIEGDVEIAEPLLQEKGIFVVPLTILIP